jgi:prolycopene isomerase
VPTLADPSLAPAGEHLLVLTTLIPYGAQASWRKGKDALTARLLELAERHFPGLRGRLELVESGTPRTLERYTRNTGGALYGWELSPAQVGSGRLASATPIAGLRLVGHWTQPGGGVYGVVSSGIITARSVLGPGAGLDLA